MISEELKAIIDKLNKQGKTIILEGATEEQITQFEKDHKIELPEKYIPSERSFEAIGKAVRLHHIGRSKVLDLFPRTEKGKNQYNLGGHPWIKMN